MADVEARYEFRVWGDDLDNAFARLHALSRVAEEVQSRETYLVALSCDDVNAKIRGGVLDIKILVNESHGCEQWKPWVKADFPLPAALLEKEVLPRLGVAEIVLQRDSYPAAAFIAEIVQPHPQLRSVDVSKRRLKYTIAGCLAEAADVTVDGQTLRTVAVESADLAALWDVRGRIGIDGHDNVNYPRALRQTLGLTST